MKRGTPPKKGFDGTLPKSVISNKEIEGERERCKRRKGQSAISIISISLESFVAGFYCSLSAGPYIAIPSHWPPVPYTDPLAL